MTLSLFDQQLFEKVVLDRFPEKTEFSKTDILILLNEMTKAEKYYPRGVITKGAKYKIFKYFVRYCLYRNLANFDTMLLLTGDKGVGKSSFAIMLAREWCSLLGIKFSTRYHIAYSNAQVQERIENLPRFHPCVSGTTKVYIKSPDKLFPYHEKINKLVGRKDFEILSYNELTKDFEFIKPEACILTSRCARVYEIELDNGTKIRATKDHQFLTSSGRYKQLKDLRDDDEIILYSISCLSCGKEFTPLNNTVKFCSKKCNDYHKFIDKEKNIKYKKYQEKYRAMHAKDKVLWGKKYRADNKDRIREGKKLERQKYGEKYIMIGKKYYATNKEVILQKNKEWRKNNRPRMRLYTNTRHKILMQTDPTYKIKRNLRRRINLALRDQGMFIDKSLEEYIGCTIQELKEHLSKQFKDNMSHQNYGEWHVDHIRPCAVFDLTCEENQKSCFNYKNLQPLWGAENLRKGAKC